MAHQDISFGSFSVDETLELFTEETNDLQFVWQRSDRVRAALGMQLTPSKQSNFLDIPSVIGQDRRSFSPGILSPNIPPNPPTSPVEDGTAEKRRLANLPASRKLNANATPFVPGNQNFPLEKNHLVATSEAKANHSEAEDSTGKNSAARQLNFSGTDRAEAKVEEAGVKPDAKPSSPNTVSSQTSGQSTSDTRSSAEHSGHSNSNSRTGDCTPEQVVADARTDNEAIGHDSRTVIQTSGEVTADSRTASDYDRTPEGAPDLPSSPSIVNPLSTVNSSQNGVCDGSSDTPATSPTLTGTRMDVKVLSGSQSPVSTKPIISCTESVDSNSKVLVQSSPPPANLNLDPCPSSTHEQKHKPFSSASSLSSQEATPTTNQVKQDGNTQQPQASSHEDTPTHETTPSQDLSQSSLSECSRQSASESLTSPKLHPERTPWPGIETPTPSGGGTATPTVGGSATTPALSATSSTSSISGSAGAVSGTNSGRTVGKSWASIVSKAAPDSSSQTSQSSSGAPQNQPPSSSIPAQARTSSQQGSSERNGKEGGAAVSQNRTNGRSVRNVGGGDGEMAPDKGSVAQLKMLGEQLQDWRVSHRNRCIQPRGLVNQGNWCYMNAPLQALLSIPSFLSLFQALNPNPPLTRGSSPTPITDALIQFVHEFKSYPRHSAAPPTNAVGGPAHSRKKRHVTDLLSGDPLRPDYVYTMLHSMRFSLSHRGRQEDAEEFLGCVLNGLHEELVSAFKALQGQLATQQAAVPEESSGARSSPEGEEAPVSQSKEAEGEGQEWEQVGPKNKSTITRQTLFSESAITEIFGGQLRSALHRQGAKESATLEPFFSLQLDIQSEGITSVREALDALTTKETVHISEADAYKRLSLARLPPVLIFHLKRFLFTSSGSQKLLKHIYYHTEMELPKDLLAPAIKSKLSQVQRTYRLWAVVYHHGKTATGGHYTSDVFHSGYGGWVRVDDSLLKPIPDEFVLKPGARVIDKNAYLLFYRRLDTINP